MEQTIWSEQAKELGQKQLASVLKRLKSSSLTDKEKEDMERFVKFKRGQGKKPQTIEKVLHTLLLLRLGSSQKGKGISKIIIRVPYEKLDYNKPDQFLEIADRIEDLNLSERTKSDYKKTIVQFMKFLDGMRKSRPRGLEFLEIKKPKPDINTKKVLKFEDVKKLALKETNPMVKALIWTAFETGARSSELISLKIGDISFNSDKVVYRIPQTKTIPREFGLFGEARKSLTEWLLIHPDKANKDAPLFIEKKGNKPLTMQTLRKYLIKSKMDGKNTTPKWWRKSAIFDMLTRRRLSHLEVMAVVGHENFQTIKSYVNLIALLPEHEKNQEKQANHCKLCGGLISPEDTICANCNWPPATTLDDFKKTLLDKVEDMQAKYDELIKILPNVAQNETHAPAVQSIKGYLGRGIVAGLKNKSKKKAEKDSNLQGNLHES